MHLPTNMPPMSVALGASRWQDLCFGGCYGCGAFQGSEPFRERGAVSFFREFGKSCEIIFSPCSDFLVDSVLRYDFWGLNVKRSSSVQCMLCIDRHRRLMYLMWRSWCTTRGHTLIDGPLIGMSQRGRMEQQIRCILWMDGCINGWIDTVSICK